MSFLGKLFLWTIIVPIVLSIASYYAISLYEDYRSGLVRPKIDADAWWSLKDPAKDVSTEVKRFIINATDADLEDLKTRLKRAKFLENIVADHTYGFRGDQLQEIRNYWLEKYDWRKWEREINSMTHYVTQIEGINVHYAVVKPTTAAGSAPTETVTMMLVHGWPGTFFEYYKLAQSLSKPDKDSTYGGHELQFELIIPSIPGYGWGEAAHKPGMNIVAVSRIFLKLMARLGKRSYYVHGGDWGSFIVQTMGRLVADGLFVPQDANGTPISKPILGVHTNMPLLPFSKTTYWCKMLAAWILPSVFLEPEEYAQMFPFEQRMKDLLDASGYFHLQATRPDTVAAALMDSPIGLAAYILEKYSAWTNRGNLKRSDGGLTEKYTMDELLTTVMVYWLSESIGSSVRLYKEVIGLTELDVFEWAGTPLRLPVGATVFPHELISPPKWFLQDMYPILVHFVAAPRGGHFPALEEPAYLARSLREFVHATDLYWSTQSSSRA